MEGSTRTGSRPGQTGLRPDVLEATRGARLVGATISEADDAWSRAFEPAVQLAKEVGATLVLADVTTRSAWTTPYGAGGVGADRGAPYSDGSGPVSKAELTLLGRGDVVWHVEAAEAQGVETQAWLADRPGVLALDRFLELFPLDVLVVPPLDDASLRERLLGDDLASVRTRMTGRVLLVAREDGSLEPSQL